LTFARALDVLTVLARRLLRREWPPGRVFLEPGDLGVQLEELVPQLTPPVRLARRDVEMRRHVEALERAGHLDRLLPRHGRVALADEEQGRRLHVGDVLER